MNCGFVNSKKLVRVWSRSRSLIEGRETMKGLVKKINLSVIQFLTHISYYFSLPKLL